MSSRGIAPWNKGLRGPKQSPELLAKRVAAITKHGHSGAGQTPTYRSWHMMKQRTLNPKDPRFYDYGGRGITVCERWLKFVNFLADMGVRPIGKSLDRIDNNGNYEPANCRWSTPQEQQANTRSPRRGRVTLTGLGWLVATEVN